MTFPMAKKHHPQLTFIAQAEIKVQEVFPKEKKEKETLMTFQMTKKYTTDNKHSTKHKKKQTAPHNNKTRKKQDTRSAKKKKKKKKNFNHAHNHKKIPPSLPS